MREAVPEDAGGIHALAGELARSIGDTPPEPGALRDRLSELLDEPRARVLVAEGAGGGVEGAATLWIKPDLAHGDTVVEVPMLVVAEGSRNRGVGRLLMEGVRRAAAESGAGLIELVATRDNEPARSFYRSQGFTETDHVSLEFVGEMRAPEDRGGG
ncbi:MAG: GNAT family N-acetyltransferase [Rubrobacter sp.]|nr:GNAT family N-acetyltransferase [Rubrobacter sp.]